MKVVDLEPWFRGDRAATATAFDEALGGTGIALLVNHGVELSVLDRARDVAHEFFELPIEDRQRCVGEGPATRGWFSAVARPGEPTELRESFATGSPSAPPGVDDPLTFGPNIYPDGVAMFDIIWTRLRGQLYDLSATLMDVSEAALGLAPGAMSSQFAGVGMNVVAHWYPSFRDVAAQADAGAARMDPRTDFGTLSVLDRWPSPAGLQVWDDGRWTDVPWIQGCLTVNVGDLLDRWTAGRWPAAVHRVPSPSREYPGEDLLSIGGFHRPAAASVIHPIDGSEPVHWGRLLEEKMAKRLVPGEQVFD